jgi:hypothetical protein
MSNIIENNVERNYKEYMLYKDKLSQEIDKAKPKHETFISKSLEMTDQEKVDGYFENFGYLKIMEADLAQQKTRLFFTYEAYKDLVTMPEELETAVKKELEGITFQQVYAVKNDELKLVNEDLFIYFKSSYYAQQKQ